MATASGMAPPPRLPSAPRPRGRSGVEHPPPAPTVQLVQPVAEASGKGHQPQPVIAAPAEDMGVDVEPLSKAPRLRGQRTTRGSLQGLKALNDPVDGEVVSMPGAAGGAKGVAQNPLLKRAKSLPAGGPTRDKEEQLWAQGYTRIAGEVFS